MSGRLLTSCVVRGSTQTWSWWSFILRLSLKVTDRSSMALQGLRIEGEVSDPVSQVHNSGACRSSGVLSLVWSLGVLCSYLNLILQFLPSPSLPLLLPVSFQHSSQALLIWDRFFLLFQGAGSHQKKEWRVSLHVVLGAGSYTLE